MSDIKKIKDEFLHKLNADLNIESINQIKSELFGKKGKISNSFKNLGSLPSEERKKFASDLNFVKDELQEKINKKIQEIEIKEINSYNNALKDYEDKAVKTRLSLTAVNLGQGLIISLGLFSIMSMAAYDIYHEKMSLGDFVVVNTFLLQLYVPLEFLGYVYREIRQSIFDMKKMFELMNEKLDIFDQVNAKNFKFQV